MFCATKVRKKINFFYFFHRVYLRLGVLFVKTAKKYEIFVKKIFLNPKNKYIFAPLSKTGKITNNTNNLLTLLKIKQK